MARSTVELIVDAVKAINPLRKVAAASKKAEQAIEGLKKSAKATGETLADMGRKGKQGLSGLAARARKAAGSFGKLGKAAALAAAAAGAAAFLRFSFGQAGELERQTKSLEVLTGSLETAKGIISELQAFGAVTPFTSTELIETAKRMKAFGFETDQVVGITKRLADVAGATGADLGGIATAFGQIQAKGRLQGEELMQLQERGVALQDELRKMYGMTGEEFSKALQKGQISAKAVEVALTRLTEKGGKYANGAIAQSDTLFGKLSTLQDALQRFGQNIGKVLSPIFKGIISFLTTITNQINNLFREAEIARKVDKELGLSGQGAKRQFRGGGSLADRRALQQRRQARIQELRDSSFMKAPTIADTTIPELTAGTAGGSQVKADMSQRLADLNSQLRAAEEGQQKRLAATLKLMVEKQKIAESNLQHVKEEDMLQEAIHNFRQEIFRIDQEIADQRAKEIQEAAKGFEAQMKHQEELRQQIAEQKSAYQELDDTFRNGIVDSILDAVDGTKSLSQSLAGVLKQMARMILQQQLMNALGSFNPFGSLFGGGGGGFNAPPVLTSGIKFFANGGRPPVGRPSVVGERGPELFVPDRAGTILPNGAGMSSTTITVNVDASETSADASSGEAAQLGKAIGLAVQQELLKQKRPGGLLAGV